MLEILPFDKMIFQSSKQEYMYLRKKQFRSIRELVGDTAIYGIKHIYGANNTP